MAVRELLVKIRYSKFVLFFNSHNGNVPTKLLWERSRNLRACWDIKNMGILEDVLLFRLQ